MTPFTRNLLIIASAASAALAQQTLFGQCGGIGWTGPTSCVSGACCQSQNAYYSQCIQGTCTGGGSTTSVTTTHTTLTTTKTSPPTSTTSAGSTSSCTFSGSGGASNAMASKTSCSTIVLSALSVPAGMTLDLTGLNTGTTVIFEGETTFGYQEWTGPLFAVSGTSITVQGASGSSLNGNGQLYWDGQGGSGGKTKPKFFQAHSLTDSTIEGITITNAPVQVFSINGASTLQLTDITINNQAGDSLGKNTDGFDIGSSDGVTITNAQVYNQDDCVAVNSGTNIVFTGGYCSGGHGLSIGSVGGRSDNTVQSVTFENSQVVNSQQAVRIKTISGDTGTVSGVTYKNIQMSGITDYGIVVDQAYDGTAGQPTNGVQITSFVLNSVTGTVNSGATDIYIDCGSGSCSGWNWSGVSVTGGKKSSSCQNVPSGISC